MDDDTEIGKWLVEIDDAKKRDEDFYKNGDRVLEIYACKNPDKVPFNILFSNTDTLIPALYSSVPRPSVRRRFKDPDLIGKAAETASTRILEFLLDTNIDGYETFDDGMRNAVIDGLLPGRGVTLVKYDAEINENYTEKSSDENQKTEDATETGQERLLKKESELVCIDSKQWNQVLFGFARKWSKVPWIAFEEAIDKQEAIRLFGKDIADKLKFHKDNDGPDDDNDTNKEDEHQGKRKTAIIYQIWDKDGGRKVRYVSRDYKDDFLKIDDDPLELTGFYPIPKPICFVAKSHDLEAIAPYLIYENQAKELSELTRRINKLVKAIKAKGIYDAELGEDIANLMDGEDNELVPADKSAAIAAERGFDNAIWFMPIQQMVTVLKELYAAREACKQVIYEVTGISDIIRGSTNANETASAQSLKSQWGTMRLKRNQAEVQRYARDMLRIMLEIAATKFSEDSWIKMTGLPFATDQAVMQAQQVMQMAQQFMSSQPPSPDGQQPQIPQQYQQIYQQAQDTLNQPKWSDVLGILKDDLQRAYRVDIETNSTIIPEAVEDQKNISEVMTAFGQYMQGITPLIQEGAFPFAGAKAMMMAIIRRFQFGPEIEEYIDQMQPPPPPPSAPPDNTLQVKQMDMQAKQMELQAKGQSDNLTMQIEQGKIAADAEIEKIKLMNALQIEQGKAATEMRLEQMRIESAEKIATFQAKVQSETQLEIARLNAGTQLKTTSMSINSANQDDEAMMELDDQGEQVPKPTIADLSNNMTANIMTMMQANMESMQKMEESSRAGMEMLAQALIRPKEVIRGPDGRVIGVQ